MVKSSFLFMNNTTTAKKKNALLHDGDNLFDVVIDNKSEQQSNCTHTRGARRVLCAIFNIY